MRKLFLLFAFLCPVIAGAHPLKMAYTAMRYNQNMQVFEIGHRVFQDDFENTLNTAYSYTNGDVFVNQTSAITQKAINAFFEKNFKLRFNEKPVSLTFKRIEQKQQMGIIVWFETSKVVPETIKTVDIYNFIMMESFKEQMNLFNLNIRDEIKRTLKFEIDKTQNHIDLR